MSLLWKKESRYENALYIDIFRKFGPSLVHQMGGCVKDFLEMSTDMIDACVRAEKCDDKSKMYRKLGDAEFHQMKWHDAIALYNQSLCFAKAGSPQMAMAYAKRVQCFYELKMYENCLIDMDLAQFSGYPRLANDWVSEIEDKCLKLMTESTEPTSNMPKLSYESNKKYPEIANILEIVRDSDVKWRIRAKQDIPVGQVILVEKSFVSTFIGSYQKCCVCSVSYTNLVPCNKCSKALLCPTCNSTFVHQVECDAEVIYNGNYQEFSDTYRSILLAMSMFDTADELIEFVEKIIAGDLLKIPGSITDQKTKYRAFLHLINDSSDLNGEAPLAFIHYCALLGQDTVIQYFHTDTHRRFLMHLVFHHLGILKFRGINTNEVGHDNAIEEIDYCLIISMNLSHSCFPNVKVEMVDGHAILITMRPIKKGQSIEISFCEHIISADVNERQRMLEDDLNIRCQCERCEFEKDETESDDLSIRDDPNFKFIIHKMRAEFEIILQPDEWNDLKKRVEHVLNLYGHQKWNKYFGSIYLLYFLIIKKEYDTFGRAAIVEMKREVD